MEPIETGDSFNEAAPNQERKLKLCPWLPIRCAGFNEAAPNQERKLLC